MTCCLQPVVPKRTTASSRMSAGHLRVGEMGQSMAQLSDTWAEVGVLCEADLDNYDLVVTPKHRKAAVLSHKNNLRGFTDACEA